MANTAPTVTTQNCTAVLGTTATGNGTITATGGINPTVEGVCYMVGTSGDPTTANFTAFNSGSFGVGAYTVSMTGLTPGTSYRVRAYATNTKGTGYGTTVQMKTAETLNGSIVTGTRMNQTPLRLYMKLGGSILCSTVVNIFLKCCLMIRGTIASVTSIFGTASATGYWGITGVTEPQHFYPFSQTGNYTDQGTTGGLDLTAQGSGNSFNNGLVLNGSGWATGANNADVCDLGDTFSILLDLTVSLDATALFPFSAANPYDASQKGYYVTLLPAASFYARTYNPAGTLNEKFGTAIPVGSRCQLVWVQSGGNVTLYINGSEVLAPTALAAPVAMTERAFAVGAIDYQAFAGLTFVGTLHRVGILKNTAWSADDVAAIKAGPISLGANITIQKMLSSLIVCGTSVLGGVTRVAAAVIQNIGGLIISACSLLGNMRQVFYLQGTAASSTAVSGRLILGMPIGGIIRSSTAVIGRIKLALHFGGIISSGTSILGAVGRFALRFLSGGIVCSTAITARLTQWLHLSGIISSGTSLIINVHTIGSQFLSGLITCATAVSGGIVSSRFFGGVIQCGTALTGMIGRTLHLAGDIINTSTILGSVQRFPAQLLGGIITCGTVIQGGVVNIGAKLIGGVITCGTYVYMGFLGGFSGAAAHGRRFVGGIYHWYVRAKEHLNIKD